VLAIQCGEGDGIGFVFTKEDPYCGIDLDSACNPVLGTVEDSALKIISQLSSYTEYSPSETGLHIIIKAKKNTSASRKDKIEIYDHARFFTFTGNIYDTSLKVINERQKELSRLSEETFSSLEDNPLTSSLSEGKELTDQEIEDLMIKMSSAQNGEKFSLLFEGRWKEVKDTGGQQLYPSASEADQALCNILAFWTDNPIAIDQIFRKSGLYRGKWNRQDYREGTIKNAFEFKIMHATPAFDSIESSLTAQNSIPLIHISQIEEKPIEFLIDQIWPINSVGFISGQPGTFKTWFVWDMAVSVASGTTFLDRYKCKQGKVIVFNAEDTQTQTKLRIAALANHKKLNVNELNLYLLNIYTIALDDIKTQEAIKNTIAKEQPSLIIFDPLRNVHTLNEDSSTEMSKILNLLRFINRKFNCSIPLVCHDKKPSKESSSNRGSQVRGTSAIAGWRDNAIYLET
jgi:hypothetical protein